ncbi:hypothetical protein DC522_30195 [Microvirga sp. KLBC 81]|nr:hypothetical protein DC522_30195 [Microvirga sp. KLBC 81]
MWLAYRRPNRESHGSAINAEAILAKVLNDLVADEPMLMRLFNSLQLIAGIIRKADRSPGSPASVLNYLLSKKPSWPNSPHHSVFVTRNYGWHVIARQA